MLPRSSPRSSRGVVGRRGVGGEGCTWDSTATPSRLRCRSVSSASAPASAAPWKAAMVFSGYLAE